MLKWPSKTIDDSILMSCAYVKWYMCDGIYIFLDQESIEQGLESVRSFIDRKMGLFLDFRGVLGPFFPNFGVRKPVPSWVMIIRSLRADHRMHLVLGHSRAPGVIQGFRDTGDQSPRFSLNSAGILMFNSDYKLFSDLDIEARFAVVDSATCGGFSTYFTNFILGGGVFFYTGCAQGAGTC